MLGQLGPSRVSKSADKTVSKFYYDVYSQIPDVMYMSQFLPESSDKKGESQH